VPKEDTMFAAGDEVLVVTSEGSEGQVRELLVGEAPVEPDEDAEAAEDEEAAGEPEPAERLQ
jgi:hypothetical protein